MFEHWLFALLAKREAALFEAPFKHVLSLVKQQRAGLREERAGRKWWIHQRPRPKMRRAINQLERYIATPRVSKHRLFVWLDKSILPDSRLVVIARDDDSTFGILHSKYHELWTLRLGGWHGVGNYPQYTPTLGFETFPFPDQLTTNILVADYADNPRARKIATAAARLNELRNNWLNPPKWVKRVSEVVSDYPDRILPVDANAARELNNRTLTNLYNERPTWLANARRDLDEAVAAAYGWPNDLSDEEVLKRLFELNQERSAAGR